MKAPASFQCTLAEWAANPAQVARGERVIFTERGQQLPKVSHSQLFRRGVFPNLRNQRDARVLVTFKRQPLGFLRPPSAASLKEHPTLNAELVLVDTGAIKAHAVKARKRKTSRAKHAEEMI